MQTKDATAETKYRELFAQQEREGLSRQETAARAGIKLSTLSWWRSELKRRSRLESGAGTRASAFYPVTIRDVPGTPSVVRGTSAIPYEVVLGGGRTLRVPRRFEASEVQALVRVLEATPC